MFEPDEELIGRVLRQLRRPVTVDASLDARVMEQVRRHPPRRAAGAAQAAWGWLTRPRTIRLSPLGALANSTRRSGRSATSGSRHGSEPFAM